MSDIEIKNIKKPVSFRKPVAKEKKFLNHHELGLNRNKKGFLTQVTQLGDEIKLLTEYSTDTIYRLDYRSMKYNYISPAVSRLLGFTPQEMKRINFRSLIVETKLVTDGLKKVSSFEELEDKRKAGDVGKWNADYLIRTKSGERIWVSDNSFPWFDENGKVIGAVGSLRDITERVKIEEKLFSDIQNLSTQDALTGLAGKANFFSAVDRELKRIKRSSEQVGLVIFDIDDAARFDKNISDRLMIEVAHTIKTALRETDVLARIEGGMFAVMLPETEMKGAYSMADRVRELVTKKEFTFGGDKKALKCTISAGVANASAGDNLSVSDFFKLADTRLYIAKKAGKSQVDINEIIQLH